MSPLFGASRRDREHLLVALRSLGPTSIAGLSAALSWPTRRTDRTVRDITRRREAAFDYEPTEGSISFAVPHGSRPVPSALAPVVAGSIPEGSVPGSPTQSTSVPPAPPTLTSRPLGPGGNCDHCGVRMAPTGTGNTFYCPECGRLATLSNRRASGDRVPPAPSSPPAPPPSNVHPPVHHPPPSDDRRAQEMFAAWVTSQPIPCPRCRTPLRHRGVGEYGCPACGERVMFGRPTVVPASAKSAAMAAR